MMRLIMAFEISYNDNNDINFSRSHAKESEDFTLQDLHTQDFTLENFPLTLKYSRNGNYTKLVAAKNKAGIFHFQEYLSHINTYL